LGRPWPRPWKSETGKVKDPKYSSFFMSSSIRVRVRDFDNKEMSVIGIVRLSFQIGDFATP